MQEKKLEYVYLQQLKLLFMPLHFKPYLNAKAAYKGGKSLDQIETKAEKIFKLSSNENPLGSSPKAIEALKKHIDTLNIYPDNSDERLRAALSTFYEGRLQDSQFITTNSGVANLELIVQGFMDEDSECIYSNPAFGPYFEFPAKFGARAINVPLTGDNFDLDVDGILNAVNQKTRIVFITSPNNPTGTYISKQDVDRLVEGLPDHVVLVYDEVYYQYADAKDYVRALPYVLNGKNVIGVNSFSKAYGLAGLRIGYSYSTKEISEYLRKIRRPFMINMLSLEAAMAALGDDDFIKKTVALIHKEKNYVYHELDKMDVKYWKTQANFFLVKPKLTPLEFEAEMIKYGVMVRPVAGFGAPECIRVTLGTREANETFLSAYSKIRNKVLL